MSTLHLNGNRSNIVFEERDGKSLTDSEHHCVSQLNVVDADSGDEAYEARNDVRVIDVYRLRNGLETVQQSLCVLEEE